MSHERTAATVLVATLAIAACSGGSDNATSATTATTSPAVQQTDESAEPTGGESVVTTTPFTVDDDSPTSAAPTTSNAAVEVAAQSLPPEVTRAIRNGGGELATTSAWTNRYSPASMPMLAGAGVHLVEADLEITRTANGWSRVDALQWLYVDSAALGVDATLNALAEDAEIEGWSRSDESVVVDAAPCVMRTYTSAESDASWILQGCEFPSFPGMVSIGVTHSAAPVVEAAMPAIDPSVGQVVTAVDGTIEHVLVRFAPPATVDSTATHTVAVTVTPAVDDVDEALTTTALAGWVRSPGEANSVVFSGAPGQTWNVTPGSVRFSSQGRLAP